MRTDEKLAEICDNLRMNYGDTFKACRLSGVSVDFLMNWLRDDATAREAVQEAQRVGYMGIESAIIERGIYGVQEDVYYKGDVVGHKTVYSDGLLGKLAEARIPAYNKKETTTGVGTINGNVQINFMPRASNYDEWLAMKDKTLERRAQQALPAPSVPEVLQGDYKVVSGEARAAYLLMAPPPRIRELEGLL